MKLLLNTIAFATFYMFVATSTMLFVYMTLDSIMPKQDNRILAILIVVFLTGIQLGYIGLKDKL